MFFVEDEGSEVGHPAGTHNVGRLDHTSIRSDGRSTYITNTRHVPIHLYDQMEGQHASPIRGLLLCKNMVIVVKAGVRGHQDVFELTGAEYNGLPYQISLTIRRNDKLVLVSSVTHGASGHSPQCLSLKITEF